MAIFCSSFKPSLCHIPNYSPSVSSPNPSRFIKFRTSHREDIRYLKTLGIVRHEWSPKILPSPESAARILSSVESVKSKGFSDADITRLAALAPDLFSPDKSGAGDVDAVLAFLVDEVSASPENSRHMILHCPALIFSDVDYCLRPTLEFLRAMGIQGLAVPTNLNAHLLNTRLHTLRRKVTFFTAVAGLHLDQAERVCARNRAIFGYSIEGNLRPKFDYLVWEMERSVEELIEFPQYFAFSLEKRIDPRHRHLKERNVKVSLFKLLFPGDKKFYAKWK